MTDKYQQIIDCLETPKLFRDLLEHTKVSGSYLHMMLSRLLESEMITREKLPGEGRAKFYKYTRLVESVTYEEVISIAEYKKAVAEKNAAKLIIPHARQIAECHPYREKKKSPRVHIGCSFGQVGW